MYDYSNLIAAIVGLTFVFFLCWLMIALARNTKRSEAQYRKYVQQAERSFQLNEELLKANEQALKLSREELLPLTRESHRLQSEASELLRQLIAALRDRH